MADIMKDEFGPEEVVEVSDPEIGLKGFLVIDNTALGPGKGGIRMTPTVTVEEVFRLARTMTWKNALAGIPFGGAKAGIVWLPKQDKRNPSSREASKDKSSELDLKKAHVQSFASALREFIPSKYIAGPDVNSGEKEMQWFAEAIGDWRAATGKPADFCTEFNGKRACGLPHELGSTGFGVAQATKVAAEIFLLPERSRGRSSSVIPMQNITVAIEGFGNVGAFAFKFLQEMGAKIVAVSDSKGNIYFKDGLNYEKVVKVKQEKKSVIHYPGAQKLSADAFWGLPVDILIPAAVTDMINDSNKDKIKAKIIVEGANIPMREEIEDELWQRGICIVPDFVANAGGVISSYAEYMGLTAEKMFEMVKEKVVGAAREVIAQSIKDKKSPREIALLLAKEKVRARMNKR